MIQLKDVIQYYIGSECIIIRYDGKQYQDLLTYSVIGELALTGKFSYHIKEIKPILRKLGDMTEEEVILVLHMHMPVGWRGHEVLQTTPEDWAMRIVDKDGNLKTLYVRKDKFTPSLLHYLLKQGFDLFELIPSGQAVDAKTMNQKV